MKTNQNLSRLEGEEVMNKSYAELQRRHPELDSGSRRLKVERFRNKFGMTLCENNAASGFTLIELLVVVLIIGILASVALPQYQKAVEKTRLSEATSQLQKFEQATDLWLLENGGFPSSVVQFVGTSPQAQLPFAVEGEVIGNVVYTSLFNYCVYCATNYCDHIADRIVDGTIKYRLFQRKTADAYVRNCEVRDNSTISHFICDEMKKQGWSNVVN